MKKLLLHFVRFGPYHLARLRSAQRALKPLGWQVKGLEICSSDSTYLWNESGRLVTSAGVGDQDDESERLSITTVFPGGHYESLGSSQSREEIQHALDRDAPDAVAIAGWASLDARGCLKGCLRHKRPTILMSETRRVDGNRVWWKESLKGRLIKKYDAALVGAKSHADYLQQLGFPAESISDGYNVVDDEFFATRSSEIRRQHVAKCQGFFLCSNRFVEIKNLDRAIRAFAGLDQSNTEEGPWHLCLLGDGPLMNDLTSLAAELGLDAKQCAPWEDDVPVSTRPTVYFPGFAQLRCAFCIQRFGSPGGV